MRLRTFFCTLALAAALAPAAWADEYNRQTYLTFSGPVQLPGITLPAGTYMLKLADPGNGMLNAIQIWDRSGMHLYKTLQTMRRRRGEAPKDPIVMFKEAVAGQAQPVQSWFYPNDSTGYEFIWPKEEALKIAQVTHTGVLTTADESAKDVGLIDERGTVSQVNEDSSNASAQSSNSSASASSGTTESASASATSTAPQAPSSVSAERTAAAAPVATSGTASSQVARNDAAQTPRRQLPRTGSELSVVELSAGLSLLGAVLVGALRRRIAEA